MRARNWVAVAVVLAWAGMSSDAAAFSATYDQKAKVGRETIASKVSMKDNLFRMETTMDGMASVIIHNADGTFMVMPDQGMAMKTNLRPGQGAISGGSDYNTYLTQNNAVKTGSETIGGHACDIYEFTDASTGETVKAWVRNDIQFPAKLEIDSPQGKVLVELSNINIGASVPDSKFELPAGVQVMDMGGMMGQMGL